MEERIKNLIEPFIELHREDKNLAGLIAQEISLNLLPPKEEPSEKTLLETTGEVLHDLRVEDAFIDRLLNEFNQHGISTEDWDGDESPEYCIVMGVLRHIESLSLPSEGKEIEETAIDFQKWRVGKYYEGVTSTGEVVWILPKDWHDNISRLDRKGVSDKYGITARELYQEYIKSK